MIYNIMKPEFIVLLFLFGSLCVAFLLLSIRIGFYSSGQLAYILKAVSYLSLSLLCAMLFIKTTAPTQAILDYLNVIFYLGIVISLSLWLTTFFIQWKANPSQLQQLFSYGDLLDQIDDFVLIFDKNSELAAQNTPLNKEPLFSKQLATLNDVVKELNTPTLLAVLREPIAFNTEIKDRHFFINSSIILKEAKVIGAIVLFQDITKEQTLIYELEMKNQQIVLMNTQLLQEMKVDEALLAQKERQRLSSAIQQELGKKMNTFITMVDSMIRENTNQHAQKVHNLRKITDSLRDILAEIRRDVYESKR